MRHLYKDESGATALEYGMIAALIAAAISTAVMSLGTQMQNIFGTLTTTITTVL